MKILAILFSASLVALGPVFAGQHLPQPRAASALHLAQVTVPGGGVRPPGGTLPPGGVPRDQRAECRQKCLDAWETARQACLALQGAVAVRDCLEEILATRDACLANC